MGVTLLEEEEDGFVTVLTGDGEKGHVPVGCLDKENNQADSSGEVPKTDNPSKTVKKDYALRDDLKKDAKSSHRVTAGTAITINETKKEWSNITVTSTGDSG